MLLLPYDGFLFLFLFDSCRLCGSVLLYYRLVITYCTYDTGIIISVISDQNGEYHRSINDQ